MKTFKTDEMDIIVSPDNTYPIEICLHRLGVGSNRDSLTQMFNIVSTKQIIQNLKEAIEIAGE
jgi:hypothetical protein